MPIVQASSRLRSKFATEADVRRAMLEKLKASGLSSAQATEMRYKAYTVGQAAAMDSLPVYRAGFRIPYFDLAGKQTQFYRFRYLEYGEADGGFAALTASTRKQLRYGQPAKSLNELYLPPLLDWETISKDVNIPIFITEGELKSACACANDLACIGLGGVWCFKSAAHNMSLLPGFQWFQWKDRTVYIVYDSDAIIKPQVVKAENALARELFNTLGAIPYIVRLPSLDSEYKTGLDDFLVEKGIKEFKEVALDNAAEYDSVKELLKLNEEVLYVEEPGLIVRMDTMQRISCRSFVDHAYSTRIYHDHVTDKEGDIKLVEKCAPREWLKWLHRSVVKKITYAPGEGQIVNSAVNCWRGWGCEPATTSSPSTVRPWLELLDYLFIGIDHQHRVWFEQWLAYPLQHPGAKMYSAAVVWGNQQGTGKTLVGTTMFKIYGDNATEIGDRDLYSPHNEWAEHRQFVMADEITGGDKRNTADRMKSMITQKLIRINPKYVPSYTVPDCINYYFTSNHSDAFFLEDADRRFFVHEVRSVPREMEFYKKYGEWLNGGGPSYLFHHLLHLDLAGFNPNAHAPVTQSKKDMVDAGKSDVGRWVAKLKQEPEQVLKMGDIVIKHTLFTADELWALYDPDKRGKVTIGGMSKELKRSGLPQANNGMVVKTLTRGNLKLWIIRGDVAAVLKMKTEQIAALYDSERTVKTAGKKQKFQ